MEEQAIWQIYLLAPRYTPKPKFNVSTPEEAVLLFLPYDRSPRRRKVFSYALTVVSVASP